MTHAYSESYLNNAKDRLSSFFDYAINDCKLKPDWITALFINTGYAEQFERGNPAYVAGMSGVELARAVITKAYGPKELPAPTNAEDCSPEYWAGWAVAEYQWFTGRRFKDIFERIPLSKIIRMYSVYHEMDITSFIDTMEGLYKAAEGDSNLKRILSYSSRKLYCPVSTANSFPTTRQPIRDVLPLNCYSYQNLRILYD